MSHHKANPVENLSAWQLEELRTKQRRLEEAAPELVKALEWIANVAHQCANGGLKRPGKSDSIGAHKDSERQIRDRARAALALAEAGQ